MTTVPYQYQRDGYVLMERFNGRILLADEVGLGKTMQTLLWIKRNPEARPVVVICPTTVKYQWEREAATHIGMRGVVFEGREPPTSRLTTAIQHPLIIINFDILEKYVPFIKAMNPQVVVVDECVGIKSHHAKRTKHVQEICKKGVPHVICISATPLTNQPSELYTTISLIDPKLFPSRFAYEERYCKPTYKPWGREAKGAENLDELHAILTERMMIRRLKKDVMTHLPKKRRIVVPIEAELNEYHEAMHDFLGWLSKISVSKARKASSAVAMAKIGYLKRLVGKLKTERVKTWVKDFLESTDEKIVLFAVHREFIGNLHQAFRTSSVVVDGSVTGQNRMRAVEQFQRDKRTRIFLANEKAAGVGLNGLQFASSVLAFLEFGWTSGGLVQAEGRLDRNGQKMPITAYYLPTIGTIEESICSLLQSKQKILNAVLDGDRVDVDDLGIFDQLLDLIAMKRKS